MLEEYFFHMRHYIELVTKSKDVHSLFLLGSAGIGKTHSTIAKLKELKADYVYMNGNISPLALYEFLYTQNGRVIVFDDTQGLIRSKNSIALLLGALWSPEEKRLISWNTTSKILENIPSQFEFTGKIIFIMNEVPKNVDFQTLISRCFFFKVDFDHKTLLDMMCQIAKFPEVFKHIKAQTSPGTKHFDLRLLKKLETIYQYDKEHWKLLSRPFLEVDKEKEIVAQLIASGLAGKKAVREFKRQTGLSQRTYYRIKNEVNLNEKIQVQKNQAN